MKRLFLLILVASALNAKSQGFSGVQAFLSDIVLHPTGYTGGKAGIGKMAFDGAGNKYTLGWFDGKVDVDPGPNTQMLTSTNQTGGGNMFVLKENAAGNVVWVKQFDGLPSGLYGYPATEIDADAAGNIYIAGAIRDSFDLDPGPDVYRLYTGGASVACILKLNSSGDFVWAKSHQVDTLTNNSYITGMKVIGTSIYATARFHGTVDLDPGPGILNVTSIGTRDMLFLKMDTAGNFIWKKEIEAQWTDNFNSFAIDSAANLYITGSFEDTMDFDPGPGVYKLHSTPWALGFPFGTNADIFIAKYDSTCNLIWAHSIGAHDDEEGRGISVDRFGNVFVSGTYITYQNDLVDFDPGPGVANLYYYGHNFLLKFRSNGGFVWARNAGGGVVTDDSGNVYPSPTTKLDSVGNFIWGDQWHSGWSSVNSDGWFGFDKTDTLYVTGSFSGQYVDFDPGVDTFYLSCLPYTTKSGFILKLDKRYNPYIPPASVEDANPQTAEVSVYPNPSSGIVTFSSPAAIQRIEIADLTGKVVYRAEPGSVKTEIELSGKAAGVYFYEVDCGAGKQRGKLVVY